MKKQHYIAIDLGAESGRIVLASVSSEGICLDHIIRFQQNVIIQNGVLCWDFNYMMQQIIRGLEILLECSLCRINGIGIDSWNVDFGLLNDRKELVTPMVHYRDKRTKGMMDSAFEVISRKQLYEITGQQFLRQNTLYQLLWLQSMKPVLLEQTSRLLFIAGLIEKRLCGSEAVDFSVASTSQLMDIRRSQWSSEIFDAFGFSRKLMPKIIQAGTRAGSLKQSNIRVLKKYDIDVYTVGSHDTASAVVAVPMTGENQAYLSSGTWSLIGIEMPEPVVNQKSFEAGFGNEGGVSGRIRFLKNVMGLWILQQCRYQWQEEGQSFSYERLAKMAEDAKPFCSCLNPDAPSFFEPGQMPRKILSFLQHTGQVTELDKAGIIRLILESLAFRYREVIDRIEEVTGRRIEILNIVGGGANHRLMCQFTANASGRKVIAGPTEATVMGNVIVQAVACGQLKSIEQGRELISYSFPTHIYEPQDTQAWNARYPVFLEQCSCRQGVN